MAEYIQNRGLPPSSQTLTSYHLGFRLPFLPIFAGLPSNPTTFWAINSAENHRPIDLDIDGTSSPRENTQLF